MIKTLPDNEIRALFRLLQDEDEKTSVILKKQLKNIMDVQPVSIQTMVSREFPQFRPAINSLLEESRWEAIESELKALSNEGENLNLEKGLFLLSKFAYPQITEINISRPLDLLAAEVEGFLRPSDDPPKVIETMNTVLFEKQGFKGCRINYHAPDNSLLYGVIRKKLGSSVSLSSVYILLAGRLDIPVSGVELPGYFLVRFKTLSGSIYLDPFRNGRQLTPSDCRMLISRQHVMWDPMYLSPVSSRRVLVRTITNLVNAYMRAGNNWRVNFLKHYLEIFK